MGQPIPYRYDTPLVLDGILALSNYFLALRNLKMTSDLAREHRQSSTCSKAQQIFTVDSYDTEICFQ